jgi:hypothetical protein
MVTARGVIGGRACGRCEWLFSELGYPDDGRPEPGASTAAATRLHQLPHGVTLAGFP